MKNLSFGHCALQRYQSKGMSFGSLYANNKVSISMDEKLICLSSNFRKIQTGIASNRGDAVYNQKGSRALIKR